MTFEGSSIIAVCGYGAAIFDRGGIHISRYHNPVQVSVYESEFLSIAH
jgi:hypothetical protein